VSLDQRGAALNAVGGRHPIGKFEERLGENALTAVDIHDALVIGQIWRGRGDGLLRNALGHGLAFELSEPLVIGTAGTARRSVRRNGPA
jgi:hypothetical protein